MYLLLLCAYASAAAGPWAPGGARAELPRLRFARDRTFKIAQFTDLHLGESEQLDQQSRQVRLLCVYSRPAPTVAARRQIAPAAHAVWPRVSAIGSP